MRLIDVRFSPGSLVEDLSLSYLGMTISFNEEKLTEQTWGQLIKDFEKTGISFVPYDERKSIMFTEVANANDVIIAKVLTQHGAMEQKDLLKIQQLFLKNFCLYLQTFMTEGFRQQHQELATVLDSFKEKGISPETVKQIPHLFKLLPEKGIEFNRNNKIHTEYPLFKATLRDVYCHHYQSFITTANQKILLQALSRNLTGDQVKEIEDQGVKKAFEILCNLPAEIAFRIIDFVSPGFSRVKISDDVLNSYATNRKNAIASILQPSTYNPEAQETYKPVNFREQVVESRKKNAHQNVLL